VLDGRKESASEAKEHYIITFDASDAVVVDGTIKNVSGPKNGVESCEYYAF